MQAYRVVSDCASEESQAYSHRCSALGGGVTHDDTLRYASDRITFPVSCRIKEMVCGFLEGREHENAVLHLGHTETCDTENFALQGSGL